MEAVREPVDRELIMSELTEEKLLRVSHFGSNKIPSFIFFYGIRLHEF